MAVNKKQLDTEFEKIVVLGEGSVEEAKSIFKEEEKESKHKRDIVLDTIDSKSKHNTFLTYNALIADLLAKRLNFYVEPRGFTFKVLHNAKGVILELYAPNKQIFRSAFKPTGIAEYDLNAIEMYGVRTENTIDKWEHSIEKQQSKES